MGHISTGFSEVGHNLSGTTPDRRAGTMHGQDDEPRQRRHWNVAGPDRLKRGAAASNMRKKIGTALVAMMFLVLTTEAHGRTPDIEMGARLVKARCTVCHSIDLLPELVERCANRRGLDYLDDFLKRHHAPEDEVRVDIIAFLTCSPEVQQEQ